MTTIPNAIGWFPIIAVGVALGCSRGAGTTPVATTPVAGAPTIGTAVPEAEMQKHRADPTSALLDATNDLELSPTQKDRIRALDERHRINEREVAGAARTLHADLAAQVRAGQGGASKIRADEAGLVSALEAHIAKESDVLNGLHAVLDPSQRRSAAASARATLGSTRSKLAASAEQQPGMAHGESPQGVTKRKLDRLTRELDLDAAQQQQVAKWLSERSGPMNRDHGAKWRHMDALVTAFEGDTFDAKTKIPPNIAAEVHEHIDRKVAFLSVLVPILRPEQREKLAANIEKRTFHERDEHD